MVCQFLLRNSYQKHVEAKTSIKNDNKSIEKNFDAAENLVISHKNNSFLSFNIPVFKYWKKNHSFSF